MLIDGGKMKLVNDTELKLCCSSYRRRNKQVVEFLEQEACHSSRIFELIHSRTSSLTQLFYTISISQHKSNFLMLFLKLN